MIKPEETAINIEKSTEKSPRPFSPPEFLKKLKWISGKY